LTRDWIGRTDPGNDPAAGYSAGGLKGYTRYGIRLEYQQALASIRTDLDSFSEVEAYSLMASGYLTASERFETCVKGFPSVGEARYNWHFLKVASLMGENSPGVSAHSLLKRLDAGRNRAFKALYVSPSVTTIAMVCAVVLLWAFWPDSVRVASKTLLAIVLAVSALAVAIKVLARKTFTQVFTSVAVLCGVFLFAFAYLRLLNPLYLRNGRLREIIPG
jgi:hypothetical protein